MIVGGILERILRRRVQGCIDLVEEDVIAKLQSDIHGGQEFVAVDSDREDKKSKEKKVVEVEKEQSQKARSGEGDKICYRQAAFAAKSRVVETATLSGVGTSFQNPGVALDAAGWGALEAHDTGSGSSPWRR